MSKATFAIIAAAGAATGASVTALFCRPSRHPQQQPLPAQHHPHQSLSSTSGLPPPPPTPGTAAAAGIGAGAATPAALAAGAPVDPTGLFQYGFPGPIVDELTGLSLTSAYDRRMRNPHWVAEHITAASLRQRNADRKHSVFVEDERVPIRFRAQMADYFRSGYDRGHQVPAADAKWSQAAMNDTFALTNMCPQVGDGFNRDYWSHVEDFVRRLTNAYPSVRVVTGPLYLPHRDPDGKWRVSYEVIGSPPNVAVPTHFYKVIFGEQDPGKPPSGNSTGPIALGAFVLPNARIPNQKPLADFEVPLEAVERASGLEFASKLPAARRRRLCKEVKCEIVVREFGERAKKADA